MTRLELVLALATSFVCSSALAADPSMAAPPDTATATAAITALHLPEVSETRLDNGLVVLLEENHASPYVAMILEYDAGSRFDPPGKAGLAYLTQHLATAGTKHAPAGTHDATLDRIGATERGWNTTLDVTAEWATVPSNAVDSVLWLWSDEMGFFAPSEIPSFAAARFLDSKMRADRVTSVPLGMVPEIVQGALFPGDHPYHSTFAAESRTPLTLDDVRAFHDHNVAPNTAALVLVGDFQTASMLERVRTYFAPLTAAPARGPAPIAPAQLEDEVRLDVAASVKSGEVWMDWRTPPFFAAGDAELDIGSRALVGARVSTLRWILVDKLGVSTRVMAHQMSHTLGSDFRITADVANGHTPEQVIAAIDILLGALEKSPLRDDLFAGARSTAIVPYIHKLDRASRRASIYAELWLQHRDPKWIGGDVARYDTVTPTEVNATMARWLTKGHRVVTVITPDAKAPVCGVLRAARGEK